MTKTINKQNRLASYLTVAAGVGCAASAANGAVVFFGPGAQSPTSTPATPAGISIGTTLLGGNLAVNSSISTDALFASDAANIQFTSGTDLTPTSYSVSGLYADSNGDPVGGAVLNSDQNYINISFDGDSTVFEAVAQFSFDGNGGGYLVAIATNDAPNAADPLSISAGRALIEAATVPEPSSLALLALGASGIVIRRQRKKAV